MAFVAISVASCSSPVPTDGFKDLKYGMTLEQLKAVGFDCKPDESMCMEVSGVEGPRRTLFGKEATVYPATKEGILVSIDVGIPTTTAELISLFSEELGEPKSFTYESFIGQSEKTYWLSGSKQSAVVIIGNSGTSSALIGSAQYLGPDATTSLMQEVSENSIQSGDL